MNRRQVITAASGVSVSAVGGCLGLPRTRKTVTPIEKRLTGRIGTVGSLPGTRVITLLERRYYSESGGPYYTQHTDSSVAMPADDEPFLLDDETVESLERQYGDLRLSTHVCADGLDERGEYGCTGPQLSRKDFNKFTLADELEVRFSSDRIRLSVRRVNEGAGKRQQ